jgi:hypothetical protein
MNFARDVEKKCLLKTRRRDSVYLRRLRKIS